MPALPDKPSRRKYSTPRAKSDAEDVWKRTFNIMGLELLSSNKEQSRTTTMATASYISPPQDASLAQGSEKKKMTILELPSETQKDIFKYSDPPDLIVLSLVSKHFREIAAEQLYRKFHIIFPDSEDIPNESPFDGLAGALDTFATSGYDYAQHLREIILEPLSGGVKGERAYRQYHYDVSCGKFMNTLLLLTLRKARSLETFIWDIRVELSREVFKALHGIRPLQHLYLRMQAGHSISHAPPAVDAPDINDTSYPMGMLPSPPHHSSPPFMPLPLGYPVGSSLNSFSAGSKILTKSYQKNVQSLLPAVKQAPPTLSGFKNLKTLAILDMDTLDYVSEMHTCIGNSSSTLSSLKLSFSDELANKSRKPPPEVLSDDDSDQEDEFGQAILPPGPPPGPALSGAADPNGPSKALNALDEKKKQESFLAGIFGMQKEEKGGILDSTSSPPTVGNEQQTIPIDELRKRFLRTLAPVTLKLFAKSEDSKNLGPGEAEILDLIMKFAAVTDIIAQPKEGQSQQHQPGSVGSSTAKATPASSTASMDERAESDPPMTGGSDERGLFDEPTSKKKVNGDPNVSNPDDIDVEESEGQELVLDSDPTALEATTDAVETEKSEDNTESSSSLPMDIDSVVLANRIQVLESHLAIHNTTRKILSEAEKLKKRIEELKADIAAGKPVQHSDYLDLLAAEKAYTNYNSRLDEVTRDLQYLGDQMDGLTSKEESVITSRNRNTEMSDYIRSTRGLTLTTLAISLIPIRASILSRAVDLRVLQSITLLNVGHQTPFWNIMARENNIGALPLHKIYTDNVTLPFLAFVSQLDNVTELLLLERTQKARVESTTAKTTVTMEQIRRVVLKKHAATLKILMLRNEAGIEWDMNAKTAMLLCHRAKLLEELAVSFGVKTMHTFLQFMPGLVSLRAFHTIQFRTDDTCLWVCREFRRFTVDNVSHNPHMKLEFIALDNSVERLVRRVPLPKNNVENKGKGKEIAGNADGSSRKTFAQLVFGSDGTWPDGTPMSAGLATGGPWTNGIDYSLVLEDSEDDEGAEWSFGISGKIGLKVETIEGMRFCNVTGVRIFEKDVLGGRL